MRSINIYWDIRKRDKHRGLVPPQRKRSVEIRFTAVGWIAAIADVSLLAQAPAGAYPLLSDALWRISSSELKLKMNLNDVESKIGGELDA
ncbi:MAG TPA: hypothetical protein VMW85_07300 [Methanomassiliicoccales archaeon]|nr:hypothetical protein [Methanomassiliicoccales archaeon]